MRHCTSRAPYIRSAPAEAAPDGRKFSKVDVSFTNNALFLLSDAQYNKLQFLVIFHNLRGHAATISICFGGLSMAYVIKQELCSACHRCRTGCPVQAIRFKSAKYWIDPEKCISCGKCVKVCHNGCISDPEHPAPAAPAHEKLVKECDVCVIGRRCRSDRRQQGTGSGLLCHCAGKNA